MARTLEPLELVEPIYEQVARAHGYLTWEVVQTDQSQLDDTVSWVEADRNTAF